MLFYSVLIIFSRANVYVPSRYYTLHKGRNPRSWCNDTGGPKWDCIHINHNCSCNESIDSFCSDLRSTASVSDHRYPTKISHQLEAPLKSIVSDSWLRNKCCNVRLDCFFCLSIYLIWACRIIFCPT